jgi:Ca2+-binding RTX toxin-like protein
MDAVVAGATAELDVMTGTLQVRGTSESDRISITRGRRSDLINVRVNRQLVGSFPQGDVDLIVLEAKTGNDRVSVSRRVREDFIMRGGAGNDRLYGAMYGNNILVGGEGNDTLRGGRYQDLVIGGTGRDRVMGHHGDDVVIGGDTAYDLNDDALLAILDEWSGPGNYATRIAALRTGDFSLTTKTVFGDGDRDRLYGQGGSDWFWVDDDDRVAKRRWEEADASG